MQTTTRILRPILVALTGAALALTVAGCGDDQEVQVSGEPSDQSAADPDSSDGASSGSNGGSGEDPDTAVSSPPSDDPAGGSDPTDLPDMTPMDAAEAQVLVGMTLAEAENEATGRSWSAREARRDGEDLMLTEDFSPTRVNVATEDGSVTEVLFIG